MKKRIVMTTFCILAAGGTFLVAPVSSAAAASQARICAHCQPAGYHAFGPVPDFRGDPYSSSRGQCAWWAATRRLDERFFHLGNLAYQWAANAPKHGFKTGSAPRVGATVIFQRGVQGASSWGGHAGHVVAVYGGGWFLISEMNFYANGGGWDRVDYRYVHTGSGVSFIY
jgi:CHAP domain